MGIISTVFKTKKWQQLFCGKLLNHLFTKGSLYKVAYFGYNFLQFQRFVDKYQFKLEYKILKCVHWKVGLEKMQLWIYWFINLNNGAYKISLTTINPLHVIDVK